MNFEFIITFFISLFSSVSFLFALCCLFAFTFSSISFIQSSTLVSIGIGVSNSSILNFSPYTHILLNALTIAANLYAVIIFIEILISAINLDKREIWGIYRFIK